MTQPYREMAVGSAAAGKRRSSARSGLEKGEEGERRGAADPPLVGAESEETSG